MCLNTYIYCGKMRSYCVPISIYTYLVYYQRRKRKLWIVIFLFFLLVLYIIHRIQRNNLYDAIIIGTGTYSKVLNSILETEGKKVLLLTPERLTGLTLCFEENLPWIRSPQDKESATMYPLSEEELLTLTELVDDVPLKLLEEVNTALPSGELNIRTLISSYDNLKRVSDIKSIEDLNNLQCITTSTGEQYYTCETFLVEYNTIQLLEKYIDLNTPINAIIATDNQDQYITSCTYNPSSGLYCIEGKNVHIKEMRFNLFPFHPEEITVLDTLIMSESALILYLLARKKFSSNNGTD